MDESAIMLLMKNGKTEISATEQEARYRAELERFYPKSLGTSLEKLVNFPKYAPRQSIATFLAKYEMFKKILDIHGSIIECGVHLGGGLMTFAQLSAILESVNYTRKIIGFDTFEGFPHLAKEDSGARSEVAHKGAFAISAGQYEELQELIRLFDLNRPLGHIPKIELVKGDATKTMSKYLRHNPHTVVSLLYLDFDVFDPTRRAIEIFLPRMPKGSIIAFDELNSSDWPGETFAVLKSIGLSNLRIQRFPFTPALSYAILG